MKESEHNTKTMMHELLTEKSREQSRLLSHKLLHVNTYKVGRRPGSRAHAARLLLRCTVSANPSRAPPRRRRRRTRLKGYEEKEMLQGLPQTMRRDITFSTRSPMIFSNKILRLFLKFQVTVSKNSKGKVLLKKIAWE